MHIRRARNGESATITELAKRSKAYWDYSPEFLSIVAPLLAITESDLNSRPVFVAETRDELVGLYAFGTEGVDTFLTDLFVEPKFIGSGLGLTLWNHAVGTAAEMGLTSFLIESDPNAERFYLRRGALHVGTIRSASGRDCPLLRYILPQVESEPKV